MAKCLNANKRCSDNLQFMSASGAHKVSERLILWIVLLSQTHKKTLSAGQNILVNTGYQNGNSSLFCGTNNKGQKLLM